MTEGVSSSLSPVGFGILVLITVKQYSLWGRHMMPQRDHQGIFLYVYIYQYQSQLDMMLELVKLSP